MGFYTLARQADPDYPSELTFPDHTFGPGQTLEIGGVRFETAEFGPGESETATAYYEPTSGALFSGDLTNNHATPALLEGHTRGWLTNLDLLLARFPEARTLYSGHGAPAEPIEQIDAQRGYLLHFRELVRPAIDPASLEGETVTREEEQIIISNLDAAYPDYPLVASLQTLKQENVKAVARELLSEEPMA
jgi:glyoxylase-like metal-dependent hydrolase (beta-lactamase superfamily II)